MPEMSAEPLGGTFPRARVVYKNTFIELVSEEDLEFIDVKWGRSFSWPCLGGINAEADDVISTEASDMDVTVGRKTKSGLVTSATMPKAQVKDGSGTDITEPDDVISTEASDGDEAVSSKTSSGSLSPTTTSKAQGGISAEADDVISTEASDMDVTVGRKTKSGLVTSATMPKAQVKDGSGTDITEPDDVISTEASDVDEAVSSKTSSGSLSPTTTSKAQGALEPQTMDGAPVVEVKHGDGSSGSSEPCLFFISLVGCQHGASCKYHHAKRPSKKDAMAWRPRKETRDKHRAQVSKFFTGNLEETRGHQEALQRMAKKHPYMQILIVGLLDSVANGTNGPMGLSAKDRANILVPGPVQRITPR